MVRTPSQKKTDGRSNRSSNERRERRCSLFVRCNPAVSRLYFPRRWLFLISAQAFDFIGEPGWYRTIDLLIKRRLPSVTPLNSAGRFDYI
jgi:hypothetical protein